MAFAKSLCVIASLAALGACGSKTKDKDQSSPSSEPSDSSASDSGGGAAGLFGPAGAMAMGSMFSEATKPGIYDAPAESDGYSSSSDYIGVLSLSGPVVEMQSMSIFGGEQGIELRGLQDRLRELAEDDKLKGLLLRADGLSLGMSRAAELRQSLVSFKGDGARSLNCHVEGSSNVNYYLLTVCDSIGIAPTGEILVSGVAAMPMHLKGLLDKLEIKADFMHVGDYKGAAEPLTLDKPSKEMEETIAGLLDQSYDSLVAGISEGRGIAPDVVKGLIDKAMFSSGEAVEAKLADQEAIFEDYRADKVGELEWKKLSMGESEAPSMGKLMEMLGVQGRKRDSSDHVAVVYAVGNVVDGSGDGIIGAREQIASKTLTAALRRLADADSVKAVVLRVDSPGGSALASEIIWHAVEELKARKPVVVSMGSVAASGGYYISAGANKIYAEENTVTGSIGVVGGRLAIADALENLGIKAFPVGRGKRALMMASLGPWNSDERAAIKKMMEDIYGVFVSRVAAGRKMDKDKVHEIAQGRVWTGAKAKELGLVDEIGGLDEAVAHAHELAGIDTQAGLEIYPPQPTLMDFFQSFAGNSPLVTTGAELLVAQVESLAGPELAHTLERTLKQIESFRDSQVQTALILPVVY